MDSEDSLEAFIQSLDQMYDNVIDDRDNVEASELNGRLTKAPKMDTGIFCRFPILMKKDPRERESPKNGDCKKCQLTKKRLEEKIEKLEATVLFQQDQLFELYSHLKARVSHLEQKTSTLK
jgi:hypothetical protein